MNAWSNRLRGALEARQQDHLIRSRPVRSSSVGVTVEVDGKKLWNFASNDYLGLASHPELVAAWSRGARRWGVGAGASHLLSGHTSIHAEFEAELAEFLGRESAVLFSTGYMCNLGLISAVARRGEYVLEDRLNHASLIDGAILARSRLKRYPHADSCAAAQYLHELPNVALLVTDGVFSMDGDLAPLPELARSADEKEVLFAVDDAHGFGVLGESGKGSTEFFGLDQSSVPALVVTFGKALGVFGAAVVGPAVLIDGLVNFARPHVYTTALPPAVPATLSTALGLLSRESWRREKLMENIALFSREAADYGLQQLGSRTPIQPIVVGSSEKAIRLSTSLAQQGFLAPAVRPPTVPRGSARLRVTLSALHEPPEIKRLVSLIASGING